MNKKRKADELLKKIVDGKVALSDCQKWLENEKNSSESCDLKKDELSQPTFVSYFIYFLRDRGRLIQNLHKNYIPRNPAIDNESLGYACNKDSGDDPFSSHHRNDYSTNFPSTKESSSQVLKSKRRINPTPISDEEGAENTIFQMKSKYPVTKGKAEKFSRIFSTQEGKSNYKYQANGYNTWISTNRTESRLSFNKLLMLDKIVDLYVFVLIKKTIVPNITTELRFLLNMLDTICDKEESYVNGTHIFKKDQINILSSINEWHYFCLKTVVSLEPLLVKMEYIIRKFIYTKLLKFIPTSQVKELENFASKLLQNPDVSCNLYDITHEETRFNFNSSSEQSSFREGQTIFREEQKNWSQCSVNEEMFSKLDFISNFDGSVKALYCFGELFVESLINSIQETDHSKADNEKKIAKLRSRLIKPLPSEPDNEPSFTNNELFFKNIIDYCALHHPNHVHYIKYWLCFKICELSKKPQEEIGDSLPRDIKTSILLDLKFKISLSKFVGYIEFFNRKSNWELTNEERDILVNVYSQVHPYLNIQHFLINALEIGTLTINIPWIVQYLCMADKCTPYIPYYYDTISILISIYLCTPQKVKDEGSKFYGSCENNKENLLKLSLMLPSRHSNKLEDVTYTERKTFYIKETPSIFLKLWIGKLFDCKTFGESIFYEFYKKYITNWSFLKKGGASPWPCIDCTDLIDNGAFYVLCAHFSKLKYWENTNAFSRNIRPILLEPESEERPSNIAMQIEEQFLSDYQNIKSLINFVISRISNIFENKLSRLVEEEIDTALSDVLQQQITDIVLDCKERATVSLKALIPTDLPESVVDATFLICSRKLNEVLNTFLNSKGLECSILNNICIVEKFISEPQHIENVLESACLVLKPGDISVKENHKNDQEPLSRVFCRVNTLTRQLANGEDVTEENVLAAVKSFSEISDLLDESCDKQLWEDVYNMSWNYTLQLIIIKPELATEIFLDKSSSLWQKFHSRINELRILCHRVISPSAVQEKIIQKKIAKKIGQLVNLVLEKQLLSSELLVAQCVSLLQFTWTKCELEFIEIIIGNVLDIARDLSISERLSIEAVADQVDAMKCFESP